jgi:hypothetical protein
MSGRPSPDALDTELTHHVDEQARIADALLELERHPGHRLLATAALTGVTATRWVATQGLLASLWADLATYRAVVADACAVRTRRPRPGEREWAELHELLVVRPVGPPARGTALAESVTLAELAVRMDARLQEVAGVLEAAETVHLAALAGLGPLAERVRDAQARARELLEPDDPDGAALTALACAIDARLATCTNDPLSLPARLPRDLVDGLEGGPAGGPGDGPAGGIAAIEVRLAERAAARDAWADRRRAVADAVAALDALCDREAHARRGALDRVAGVVFAAPPDPRPALRRRLAGLPAQRPDAACLAALPRLAADVGTASDAVRAALGRATGLTDRRAELAGRFGAYRAKALRLGASDDPQVVALTTQICGLLAAPRTDLPALTRALVAYQERVNEAEGRPA